MRLVVVGRDLITATRLMDAATAAGHEVRRVDHPGALPDPSDIDTVFIDWDDRQPGWADALRAWRQSAGAQPPRLVLFGSHRDLAGHREARAGALGPVMARSRLFASLSSMLHA